MQEEVFGPILPIVPVDDLDSAIEFVNARDNPLALYVFSQNKKFQRNVVENTLSGSVFINDTMMQYICDDVPVAGVGASGYGAYGGKAGFDTFTHRRAQLDNPSCTDSVFLNIRFPPYTPKKAKLSRGLLAQSMPYPRPGTAEPKGIAGRWRRSSLGTFLMAVLGSVKMSMRS